MPCFTKKQTEMKQSIFNSIIDLTESSFLVYNSYSDSFFLIKNELKGIFCNIEEVKRKYPLLYRRFVKAGVYVPNNVDEFQNLLDRYKTIANNDSSFFLMINPTLDCNFRCWYCYEHHMEKSEMNKENYNKVKIFIDRILATGIKSFTLSFFGGEPMLKYRQIVLPLIKYTSKKCAHKGVDFNISFTSNGSLFSEDWIIEMKKYGNISLQITLDGSRDIHNKTRFFKSNRGSYDIIVRNIYDLLLNGCYVRLRINYTQESVNTIKDIIPDFAPIPNEIKKNMLIDFHRVWQDKDSMDIIPEIRESADLFRNSGFEVLYNSLNEISNCCYADKKNTALINFNGDVYKCSARDFTKDNRDGFLNDEGQIIWYNSPEHRLSLKLSNKPCQKCRIAPLCGGGCSNFIINQQKNNSEYCLYNHNEDIINKLILDRFETYCR